MLHVFSPFSSFTQLPIPVYSPRISHGVEMKEAIISTSPPIYGKGGEKTPESRDTQVESNSNVTWTPEEEKALIKKYGNIKSPFLSPNAISPTDTTQN